MPKNVITTDAVNLASVPLPNHGSSYTVVSHKFIIDETLAQLALSGFVIKDEDYCRNLNGEVASGIYHLEYGNDPDLGLMFTWSNSYDKTMRFRCAIGGYTHLTGARLIAGDMSNYGRVHTGDALEQVESHIKAQIQGANNYFTALVRDKDLMKEVDLTESKVAELMGLLYFKEDVLTSSMLINVKDEYAKPSFTYTTGANNLWTIYNHCILALKKAHPKSWMEQQKGLHKVVKSLYFANAPAVDPSQVTLMDQIAEVEADITPAGIEEVEVVAVEQVTLPENVTIEEPSVLTLEGYDAGIDPVSTEDMGNEEADPEEPKPEVSPEALEGGDEDHTSEDLIVEKPADEGETIEDTLPEPPVDVPVYNPEADLLSDTDIHVSTEEEPVIPLEDQVASEVVEPVSEEEIAVSAEPVVDEPKEEEEKEKEEDENDIFHTEPQVDPAFQPVPEDNSKVTSLETPDFEF